MHDWYPPAVRMRAHVIGLLALMIAAVVLPAAENDAPAQDPEVPERLKFTEDDLPKDERDPAGLSEIDEVARRNGFNYAKVTRRAARGDLKALKQFFSLSDAVDGAAAESYFGVPTVV